MSGYRTKKLREAFEFRTGFNIMDREKSSYKKAWRRFKKEVKRRK